MTQVHTNSSNCAGFIVTASEAECIKPHSWDHAQDRTAADELAEQWRREGHAVTVQTVEDIAGKFFGMVGKGGEE